MHRRIARAQADAADVTVRMWRPGHSLARTLRSGRRQTGCYPERNGAAYWDGRNKLGEPTVSGLYIVELAAGATRRLRRIMLLK
jgi:hypothetical protein